MLDVIDFMEKMGGDARLSQASETDLATALSATDIPAELQSLVLAKDAQKLGALLGTKPVCVLVAPPGPGPGPGQALPLAPANMPPAPEQSDEAEQAQDE